ncbi:hypothetical protein ABKN59_007297 [Abortiporus biennis]
MFYSCGGGRRDEEKAFHDDRIDIVPKTMKGWVSDPRFTYVYVDDPGEEILYTAHISLELEGCRLGRIERILLIVYVRIRTCEGLVRRSMVHIETYWINRSTCLLNYSSPTVRLVRLLNLTDFFIIIVVKEESKSSKLSIVAQPTNGMFQVRNSSNNCVNK